MDPTPLQPEVNYPIGIRNLPLYTSKGTLRMRLYFMYLVLRTSKANPLGRFKIPQVKIHCKSFC